jgi:succinate dehydrogenase / fumarate reductase, cytochrome b subunit
MRAERPLSPHLQVYRFAYTMAMSIFHRATGLTLSLGLVLLVAWLCALAGGASRYAQLMALMGSYPGLLVLTLVLVAFCYHLCCGIRHLVFDTGRSLERAGARRSALITVLAALLLTLGSLLAFSAHLWGEP